jgi:single-stranded DNA-binding protein
MQMNRIEIAGFLGSRPEVRYLPSGTKVANVRLVAPLQGRRQSGRHSDELA